jgi:hypothetical protein
MAGVQIEGLADSSVSVIGECTDAETNGVKFVPTQTWFCAGISIQGHDFDRVGDALAKFFEVVFSSFSIDDLAGSDGVIYGTLSTYETDAAGWPGEWVHYMWLPFERAKAAHDQGLNGKTFLEALDIVLPLD